MNAFPYLCLLCAVLALTISTEARGLISSKSPSDEVAPTGVLATWHSVHDALEALWDTVPLSADELGSMHSRLHELTTALTKQQRMRPTESASHVSEAAMADDEGVGVTSTLSRLAGQQHYSQQQQDGAEHYISLAAALRPFHRSSKGPEDDDAVLLEVHPAEDYAEVPDPDFDTPSDTPSDTTTDTLPTEKAAELLVAAGAEVLTEAAPALTRLLGVVDRMLVHSYDGGSSDGSSDGRDDGLARDVASMAEVQGLSRDEAAEQALHELFEAAADTTYPDEVEDASREYTATVSVTSDGAIHIRPDASTSTISSDISRDHLTGAVQHSSSRQRLVVLVHGHDGTRREYDVVPSHEFGDTSAQRFHAAMQQLRQQQQHLRGVSQQQQQQLLQEPVLRDTAGNRHQQRDTDLRPAGQDVSADFPQELEALSDQLSVSDLGLGLPTWIRGDGQAQVNWGFVTLSVLLCLTFVVAVTTVRGYQSLRSAACNGAAMACGKAAPCSTTIGAYRPPAATPLPFVAEDEESSYVPPPTVNGAKLATADGFISPYSVEHAALYAQSSQAAHGSRTLLHRGLSDASSRGSQF